MKQYRKQGKKFLHLEDAIALDIYDGEDAEDFKGSTRVDAKRKQKPRHSVKEEVFKCRHCKRFVCPLPSGGKHRNHCPFCLYSRHVDAKKPGDRLSECGSVMQPVARFVRNAGEDVLVHRCLGCGVERFNRIAADDDYELMLSLPQVPPRTAREVKMQQLEEWLDEQYVQSLPDWADVG
ncbi:RNHCP domain-containing protein [Thermosporothrix hazakensis]|uniref:RNHCP domain-containing protein n=2 Tax=Thermosporothrix TaxID=768650 RepID=A0A326TYQ7_THEHA|nr:RNHCP domain-containing protein [Thermosporothrix hazakensis]PZW20788.1 RNHCP domain-containing protein [Thermosporothrix hazakensis]BBH89375.1 hypothetical protein KTC_41260 [Thermosporothrix sp. COM3]GCE47557.1 hypothetical protein KTH_24260 [Thermosporothrix hazakensis]